MNELFLLRTWSGLQYKQPIYTYMYVGCQTLQNIVFILLKKFDIEPILESPLILDLIGRGGLVVMFLVSGSQGCGFKPGRGRWIF